MVAKQDHVNEFSEYTVRVSPRAKHVRIHVSVRDGIVVAVPRGFDHREIPALIEAHRSWLRRALARAESLRAALPSAERPDQIHLPAIGETWTIKWVTDRERSPAIREQSGHRIVASGDVEHPEVWRALLRPWLMRRARTTLVPRVTSLAAEHGFPPPNVSIRCQRTRWGSYSQRGNLSLNAQLLFLRPEPVRYVLFHELCHSIHLDHSPDFWALLRSHEPRTDELRRTLRTAWLAVPPWMTQRPSNPDPIDRLSRNGPASR
jgi:hypothetical protein